MGKDEAVGIKFESLKRFSGQAGNFASGAKHFIVHMAKVHTLWRATLTWFGKSKEDLRFARLNTEVIRPHRENAGELSV